MKILQSISLKMDSYNDDTNVSSHEYPPPMGKGTIHSQYGVNGFDGTSKGYPPIEGHGTQNLPLVRNHRSLPEGMHPWPESLATDIQYPPY